MRQQPVLAGYAINATLAGCRLRRARWVLTSPLELGGAGPRNASGRAAGFSMAATRQAGRAALKLRL